MIIKETKPKLTPFCELCGLTNKTLVPSPEGKHYYCRNCSDSCKLGEAMDLEHEALADPT